MRKIISVSIVLIFFCVLQANSQPKFSVGPLVGISVPTGDYGGTTLDFYNGARYGLGTGFTLGGVFKAKFSFVGLRVGATYSAFSNTGIATTNEPASYIQVKQNLFTLSAGPEFAFTLTGSPIKPYLGIDLLFTSLSGQTTFNDNVPKVSPPGTYDMSGSTRLGLGLGGGVEFNFAKSYALDVGLRFNIINLFGKTYTPGPNNDRINTYLYLNDDADPSFPFDPNHHPIATSRSISVLQINVAFLFGF